jgi:hypothetical protein
VSLILLGAPLKSAHAVFVADIEQQGSNVVVTGSGTLNLTALPYVGGADVYAGTSPLLGFFADWRPELRKR